MSCNPVELLNLAKSLQLINGSEATLRCVVSRAYYAALHEVQLTFEQRSEFKVDGESSHAEIISRATVYASKPLPGRGSAARIAKAMPRLRRARNLADYRLLEDLRSENAAEAVNSAEEIMRLCKEVATMRSHSVEHSGEVPAPTQPDPLLPAEINALSGDTSSSMPPSAPATSDLSSRTALKRVH